MVQGDAPVMSSDLKTSVSWLNGIVKGIRQLRLNQDGLGTTSGQLNSAWRSVPVRTSVVKAEQLLGRVGGSGGAMGPCEAKAEPGHEQGERQEREIAGKERNRASGGLIHSGKARMDTRQKDKEKEKEKDMAPGERTPKIWRNRTKALAGSDLDRGKGKAPDLDRGKGKAP
ncbi:hypothetical protein F2Q69_00010337 [Brassica cretica]|uniref:Uncharacterized protein n=1 Tax=Brassica cretica TaxID=69181 RepID=A0A8S9QFQ3_BRACR|nr:hypothetical protein F2Q69_00010337 [Brassica cretica]